MAYQINYGPPFPKHRTGFPLRLIVLTTCFFVLFLLAVKIIRPSIGEELTRFLLPFRNNTDFHQAVKVFFTDLKNGAPFYQSLTAFCQEIINHANIPSV